MKKPDKRIKFKEDDNAKLDGMKAVGCLFAGVVILLLFLYAGSMLVTKLRPNHENNNDYSIRNVNN